MVVIALVVVVSVRYTNGDTGHTRRYSSRSTTLYLPDPRRTRPLVSDERDHLPTRTLSSTSLWEGVLSSGTSTPPVPSAPKETLLLGVHVVKTETSTLRTTVPLAGLLLEGLDYKGCGRGRRWTLPLGRSECFRSNFPVPPSVSTVPPTPPSPGKDFRPHPSPPSDPERLVSVSVYSPEDLRPWSLSTDLQKEGRWVKGYYPSSADPDSHP